MKLKTTAIIATLMLQGCALTEGEWFPSAPGAEESNQTDDSNTDAQMAEAQAAEQQQVEVEKAEQLKQAEAESQSQMQMAKRDMQKASAITRANASNQQKIRMSVKNDYRVFQEINHQYIKSNQTPVKYKQLETTLSHFVMDLIANMSPASFKAPLVVRPMTLKVGGVANADAGKDLLTSLIAKQMKEYGFIVFDGRKPKGKFTGEELLLETVVHKHGEQFVLSGTLKQLSSNKIAGTNQAFITDYFFRNIQDGVEVYEHKSEFSTGGD